MIQFGFPQVFLLLPLPWLVYRFFPKKEEISVALKVPDIQDFDGLSFKKPRVLSKPLSILSILTWGLFLISAANPEFIGEPIQLTEEGRDIMLAVDLSGSMQIKDFVVNGKYMDRLSALKLMASDFIDRRHGDRIGLVLFGSEVYLQAPLTFDRVAVKQLLKETELGLAGTETAIGDAVGLAIKHLKDSQVASRVLILLTDGNNNTGNLTPEKAAQIAANANLKIHTVAIGSKNNGRPQFGGVATSADIDEKALKSMADKTGGKYFRAYNTKELDQIYKEIDLLESRESSNHYIPIVTLYYWPLIFALVGSFLLIFYRLKVIQ